MEKLYEQITEYAEAFREEMVSFVQRLVQTPSESQHEENVAKLITEELTKLGFDEVFTDPYGNVVGIYKGTGGGDNILFNCHMDQVASGNPDDWEYPPYSGAVADGYIHGRGASDTKGAMAAQVYGVYILKKLGIRLKGDVLLTFVIDEEPGDMWGMKHLCEGYLKKIPIALGVLGESTSLDVYLGHRGRTEIELISRGVMSHSSAPWLGVNAVDKMVPVLAALEELKKDMKEDAFLGKSTQSVTHISCTPGWGSTVPDVCRVWIDRRYIPGESAEGVLADIRRVITACKEKDPEINVTANMRVLSHTSYTGLKEDENMDKPAYLVEQDNPYVVKTVAALKKLGQNPGFDKWNFGTDGAYTFCYLGIPTIGYSCCEEIYTHRPKDRVNIDMLVKCAAGNASICLEVCGQA